MKNIFNKLIFVFSISSLILSCHSDLDQSPMDPDSFTEEVSKFGAIITSNKPP